MSQSPLLPVDEVIDRLLSGAMLLAEAEPVAVVGCPGRTLAGDVVSAINVPAAANSSMDGYALSTGDTAIEVGVPLPVSDRIAAGHVGQPLQHGTLARIFTGAPIPVGADAVVIQEDTETDADGSVRLLEKPAPGDNVRPVGQDIAAGATLFKTGHRLRPQDAALIASVGVAEVPVYRPLRIAVMSTGDELVEPPMPLAAGQIYNSNHYALIGMIRRLDMEVIDLGLVPDDRMATEAALARGAAQADCIISSGGVSVGEEDHVKAALEKLGRLDLWRIAIKPGKPLAFGDVAGTPFFGLPGNPVSTFVTFNMIAKPWLLKSQGALEVLPQPLYAGADFEAPAGTRREYFRVRLMSNEAGEMKVAAFPNQGSGVMTSVCWANALAEVDIGQAVRRGDRLKVFPLDFGGS